MRLHGKSGRKIIQQALEIEVQRLQVEFARLDLGEVEDVVEDPQQRFAAVAHALGIAPLLIVKFGIQQQPGHADHAVHGRADLVAHVGQELRLQTRGDLRLFARPDQLLGLPALRDIAEEGAEDSLFPRAGRANAELDGQLAAIPMERAQFLSLVQHRASTGFPAGLEAAPVAFAICGRHDQARQRSAVSLLARPAQHPLSRRIPAGDGVVDIESDDGVERGLNDRARALFALTQRLTLLPQIAQSCFQAGRLLDDGLLLDLQELLQITHLALQQLDVLHRGMVNHRALSGAVGRARGAAKTFDSKGSRAIRTLRDRLLNMEAMLLEMGIRENMITANRSPRGRIPRTPDRTGCPPE